MRGYLPHDPDAKLSTWPQRLGLFRRVQLLQNGGTATDARRLLEWPQACGNYLATLAKKYAARVQPHRTNSARLWIIRRP